VVWSEVAATFWRMCVLRVMCIRVMALVGN
jgi:hypothetical protein